MTYNVSSGTLNTTIPYHTMPYPAPTPRKISPSFAPDDQPSKRMASCSRSDDDDEQMLNEANLASNPILWHPTVAQTETVHARDIDAI